jgi:hypothetical protein
MQAAAIQRHGASGDGSGNAARTGRTSFPLSTFRSDLLGLGAFRRLTHRTGFSVVHDRCPHDARALRRQPEPPAAARR